MAAGAKSKVALFMPAVYASVGPDLAWYAVDLEQGALTKQGSVTLPGNVQEAWPRPSKESLYVAWSNGGPSYGPPATPGDKHGITTFRIDPRSGALRAQGEPVPIPSRPIHITVDVPGEHVVTAYNNPSGITVHRIQAGGTVGPEVKPSGPLDVGVYAHQVRVDPSNNTVILVTRGNAPTAEKPEDPGALKLFAFKDGMLTNKASIAPDGGYGFQCRHLDFDPLGPWMFLNLERQNQLQVYRRLEDGTLDGPLFTEDTLEGRDESRPQAVSSVHVHPRGNVVYTANRGGENSIAVFRIDRGTGEPARIQNIDTEGSTPRTFAVDPSGRILVAGNQTGSLAVFRIGDDGRLTFVRKYEVETSPGRSLFWMGMV